MEGRVSVVLNVNLVLLCGVIIFLLFQGFVRFVGSSDYRFAKKILGFLCYLRPSHKKYVKDMYLSSCLDACFEKVDWCLIDAAVAR